MTSTGSNSALTVLLLFELLSLCRSACEALTLALTLSILCMILILKASVQPVALSVVPSALSSPLHLSPQRSGWQMFGWLARHNKCVAGCLRWLLLAVLWVLHRQDRTGHFRRLFVKAGNMRTEDRSNVEDLFQFYIVLNSFIFVCALIWCMQQVVSTVVSCLINVCCIYTLRVTVTCQRQF